MPDGWWITGSLETAKQVTATPTIDTTGFQMMLNLGCCPGEANFGLSMAIELWTTWVTVVDTVARIRFVVVVRVVQATVACLGHLFIKEQNKMHVVIGTFPLNVKKNTHTAPTLCKRDLVVNIKIKCLTWFSVGVISINEFNRSE